MLWSKDIYGGTYFDKFPPHEPNFFCLFLTFLALISMIMGILRSYFDCKDLSESSDL